mmetsp:Transcript_17054/g.48457  ORF Transcript_17054/g.48457 Transcript_17054/m.48457 type:complete len:122 (-) Transcript_17054:3774-4139(-)
MANQFRWWLVVGGKTHRMAPPSPTCDGWRVCVPIPPGRHPYQYVVTDSNGLTVKRMRVKRAVPSRHSAALLIVFDTSTEINWCRNWAAVTPSEQISNQRAQGVSAVGFIYVCVRFRLDAGV